MIPSLFNPSIMTEIGGRYDHAMALWNGRIYVTGGQDSAGEGMNKVFSTQFQSDGALTAWKTETALPKGMRIHGMVASNGRLYTIPSYSDPIYSAQIAEDGSVGG